MGEKYKFNEILIKNTLAVAIPIIIFFGVIASVFLKYPLTDITKNKKIEKVSQIEECFIKGYQNIEIIAENLEYTGFDYIKDGKMEGSYYYSMQDNGISLFLLKTQKPTEFISKINIKGVIVYDKVAVNHIINEFSLATGLDYDMLNSYCSLYVINELDYPYFSIILIYTMLIIPIIVLIGSILVLLVLVVLPYKHPCIKYIWGPKSKRIIKILNEQLANKVLYKKSNVYITEDFLILKYIAKVEVLKLDDVKYMTKHVEFKRSFLLRPIKIYKLTASNSDGLYYQCQFFDEKIINDVIKNILGEENDIEEKK